MAPSASQLTLVPLHMSLRGAPCALPLGAANVANYLFNSSCLLICWPHRTRMIIEAIYLNMFSDASVFIQRKILRMINTKIGIVFTSVAEERKKSGNQLYLKCFLFLKKDRNNYDQML